MRNQFAIRCVMVAVAVGMASVAVAQEKTGSIVAGVRFAGAVPPAPDIQKPPACGSRPIHDETYVVGGDHALANVVVYVADAKPAGAVAPRAVKIDQKDCRFEPHVQAATVGSKVTVTNGDETLHTAHAFHGAQTLFNVATPPGMTGNAPQVLAQPGPMHLSCDVGHTWMSAWIYVFDHPYFGVSGADGKLTIADVPPGEYTVKAWHEKLGERSTKVTVVAGKPTSVTFDFTGPGSATAAVLPKGKP